MNRIREIQMSEFLDRSGKEVAVDAHGIYRTAGIRSFGKGIFERPTISGLETRYTTFWRVRPRQLVFSKLFAWEGAIAIAADEHDGLVFSNEFPIYDIDESVLLPEFGQYLVQWQGLYERLRSSTTGVGNRRQRVNPEQFVSTTVPLPNLDEQRRIVAKLRAALVTLPRASIWASTVADGLGRSLFKVAFTHQPVAPAGVALAPISRPTKVAGQNNLRIAGIYSFGRGVFPRGSICATDTKYSTLYRMREGDLVMSRLKAFEGAIAVADRTVDDCFVSQEFPMFQIDKSVCDPRYLVYLCRWPEFWTRLARGSKGVGSRRERVSAQALLSTEVPLPSKTRQEQVVAILDRGVGEMERLTAARQRLLDALQGSMLNAAFSGQL